MSSVPRPQIWPFLNDGGERIQFPGAAVDGYDVEMIQQEQRLLGSIPAWEAGHQVRLSVGAAAIEPHVDAGGFEHTLHEVGRLPGVGGRLMD